MNKSIRKERIKEACSCCCPRRHRLDGFFGEIIRLCTLHGVKYIGQKNRHCVERLFWIISVLSLLGFSCYMVVSLFRKQTGNPVITTFQQQETTVAQVPFPAITICNVNLVKRSLMNETLSVDVGKLIEDIPVEENGTSVTSRFVEHYLKVEFLTHICLAAPSFRRLVGEKLFDDDGSLDTVEQVNDGLAILTTLVRSFNQAGLDREKEKHYSKILSEFGEQVSHDCDDMLVKCVWNREIHDCRKIFHHTHTSDGICCSFNLMPQYIMRNLSDDDTRTIEEKQHLNLTEEEIGDWEDFGYGDVVKVKGEADNKTFPKYQRIGGKANGLSILLNPELDVYSTCGSSDAYGFKLTAQSPISFPSVKDYSIAVPIQSEIFVSIEPQVTVASEGDLASVPVEKRGCYFPDDDEAQLSSFKFYTAQNCMDECVARITFENCSCIRFFMPRKDNQSICTSKDFDCTEKVRASLMETGKTEECSNCWPSCTEVNYRLRVSDFPLRYEFYADEEFDVLNDANTNNSGGKNYSIVHLFMGSGSFYAKERKRLYTLADFVASVGGLLSLTLGFSIIAGLEIIYFFTLKAWFRFRCSLRATSEKNEDADYYSTRNSKKHKLSAIVSRRFKENVEEIKWLRYYNSFHSQMQGNAVQKTISPPSQIPEQNVPDFSLLSGSSKKLMFPYLS